MTTAGPNSGGTFANVALGGGANWSNPTHAASSDNSYVTEYGGTYGNLTNYLKATNFGFSIPAGATISGILVEIERKRGGTNKVYDYIVKIVKDGTIQGDEKSLGAEWTTSDAYASFGGSSDLWGLTWVYGDINSSSFGVAISAAVGAQTTAYIDHIRITITYTAGVPLSFVAAIAGASTTPNIDTVTSARALLASIAAASNTPDAIIKGQLEAHVIGESLTTDIPLSSVTTARALLAGIVGASTTPDATAVVWLLGELLASISATSATPTITALTLRKLLASILGASLTEDVSGTMPAQVTVMKSGWRGRELEQWKREKYPQVDRRLFLQDDKVN